MAKLKPRPGHGYGPMFRSLPLIEKIRFFAEEIDVADLVFQVRYLDRDPVEVATPYFERWGLGEPDAKTVIKFCENNEADVSRQVNLLNRRPVIELARKYNLLEEEAPDGRGTDGETDEVGQAQVSADEAEQ